MTLKIVEPALYEMLKSLAGGNVFAARAPDGQAAPFIVYKRIDADRWRSIKGPSGVARAAIQIDSYAGEYNASKQLAADVEELLDGFRGTVFYGEDSPQDTIVICSIVAEEDIDLIDETDTPFLNRVSATYGVTYRQ